MAGKTELQRRILITAYDNPRMSQAEISRHVGCSSSYVSTVLNRYDSLDAINARIEELDAMLGTQSQPVSEQPYRATEPAESDVEPIDWNEAPPISGVVLLAVIGWIVATVDLPGGLDWYVRWSLVGVCALLATGILAIAWWKGQSDGAAAGLRWLLTPVGKTEDGDSTADSDSVEKTPPAPQGLRNELYFERANKRCEWCDDSTDQPEVHHITPRSEGGANERDNLIVLCGSCHNKADSGSIARNKLRYVVSDRIDQSPKAD